LQTCVQKDRSFLIACKKDLAQTSAIKIERLLAQMDAALSLLEQPASAQAGDDA